MRARSVVVLAVHDADLALVELWPAVRQPRSDRSLQLAGMLFASGVDDHVIAVALKQNV